MMRGGGGRREGGAEEAGAEEAGTEAEHWQQEAAAAAAATGGQWSASSRTDPNGTGCFQIATSGMTDGEKPHTLCVHPPVKERV